MKWYGRIGYDREGIVREREFKTKREAAAYVLGASDAMAESEQSDMDNPLEDHWATHSELESISEGEALNSPTLGDE